MFGIHVMTNLDSNTEFWCNECDCELVVGGNSETGSFFYVSGHVHHPRQSNVVGDYQKIMFAVCKNCLKKHRFDAPKLAEL